MTPMAARLRLRHTTGQAERREAEIERLAAENHALRAALTERDTDCRNLRAQVVFLVAALDRSAPVVEPMVQSESTTPVAAIFPALGMTVTIGDAE